MMEAAAAGLDGALVSLYDSMTTCKPIGLVSDLTRPECRQFVADDRNIWYIYLF